MWLSVARLIASGWLALAYFGQQDASRAAGSAPKLPAAAVLPGHAEVELTSEESEVYDRPDETNTPGSALAAEKPQAENLPAGIASEIVSIEAAHRSILKGQPIEQWRLEPMRARYQALLKTARDSPAAEEAIRVRLGQVTQQEQAAMAAQTMAAILAESHRRDREVAEVRKRIAAAARAHARAYQAVGFIQPSAQNANGRKLYVLIGATGKTVAYLDIPPGLDPDPLLSQRVGVRGSPHYSEDLGTRLITVRALESLESRK
jgi:hypothetical protein